MGRDGSTTAPDVPPADARKRRVGWLARKTRGSVSPVSLEAHSISALVLGGVMVVVLPIAVALDHSRRLNDALAGESEALLAAGIEAAREGGRLREQLVALERLARQYQVVTDPELLALLPARLAEIAQAVRWLRGADPGEQVELALARIEAGTARLEHTLLGPAPRTREVDQVVAEIGELHSAARTADDAVQRIIDQRMTELSARLGAERAALLRLIGAMLVLSLVLAAVFTFLVAQPIRELARTLRRLGNGELDDPVRVRGPAEIARLAGELDWLRARLRENDENRHDFLRLVSHELKTPLASLREGTSLLEEGRIGGLNDTQREVTAILRTSVQRLDAQIGNVLTFSGLSQGVLTTEPAQHSLAECVRLAAQGLRLVFARRSVRVRLPHDDVTAFVDAEQLRMIMDNLLSNAVKHSPAGGVVTVELARDRRRAVIRVIDQGPGIPPADRERVFSPFFKSTSRESTSAGTGIGLAVVRLCARANGGDVEVERGDASGTVFRVALPRRAPRAQAA